MIDDKVLDANRRALDNVQGWVGDQIHHIVDFAGKLHKEHSISGAIAEVGIHHGALFFILSSIATGNDKCLAMDIFDDQHLNVDKSGKGSLATFEGHLANVFPEKRNSVDIWKVDSMSLSPTDLRERLSGQKVRLFSVDGGHTVAHVINDLNLAQDNLTPFGIVALDDFFGYHWPSVTEGYFRYMEFHNRRLAPFLIFQNKLFLTTFSEHDIVLKKYREYIDILFGEELHHKWKYSMLSGFKVIAKDK